MKQRKLRVGVIFGGRSSEHEVSLNSARNVVAALDPAKYEPVLIGIGKDGRWLLSGSERYLLNAGDPKRVAINPASTRELSLSPGGGSPLRTEGGRGGLDVVFPVLHGTYGEDGSIQGLLRMLDLPYVGPDVLGSAVGMDKDVAKRLLRDAGIPIADFLTFRRGEAVRPAEVWKRLGRHVFIKPANQGSSVGVSRARNDAELRKAVKEAFLYDDKILVEEAVIGREIECSVLGNEKPRASILGEVVPRHDFYSYEAKYVDENGAALEIPAKLTDATMRKGQELAVQAYKALCLEGMARVDFFLKKNGTFAVNEANTIPGFTSISMYPKLWEASGLAYPALIDELIRLAIERHERAGRLKTAV